MLHRASELKKVHLETRNGTIGKIKDLYFDDESWTVRYLVVDTGRWLSGRRVLLSPSSVIGGALDRDKLPVNLTKAQIDKSPGIQTDQPVSEQHQRDLHAYYGWPAYWAVTPYPMGGVAPVMVPAPAPAVSREPTAPGDPHLRSVEHVTGYKIRASDGALGQIDDFLVDPDEWIIRLLVVDTGGWLSGKKVVVAAGAVDRISWTDSEVAVQLTCDAIKASPEYSADLPLDPDYEQRLISYYDQTAGSRH